MSKMIGGIIFVYVILSILIATMNGGGGVNSTILTSNIGATDTVIPVQNTVGFLSADYIIIGGEQIAYSGLTSNSFTGCVRSNGQAHASGSMVYSQETSIINDTLNFNIGAVSSTVGLFSVVVVPIKFFTTAIPNIVRQGLPFTGVFAFISYLWFAITCGIVISLAIALVWVASGLIGKIT
jgi:hypothetical protein